MPSRGPVRLAKDAVKAWLDPTRIPYRHRLAMVRAGFKVDSYVVFELHENDPRDYLPDARWSALSAVNGPATQGLLANKLLFYLRYAAELPLPGVHAVIAGGSPQPLPGPTPIGSLEQVLDHLAEHGSLIVKPLGGDRGRGVHLLELRGDELLLDRKLSERRSALEFLATREGSLLVAKVEQAAYARAIFPDSTNSLRLVVFGGAGTGYQPFLAVAGHRFGRPSSAPVDNTAKGGFICGIDEASGRLGPARLPPQGAPRLTWTDVHPDTGARIEGAVVPGFAEIVEGLLDFSRRHPYLAYVSWDVVATDAGFQVLEANYHGSVRIQSFRPFLRDERVVAFLEHHGLLPASTQGRATDAWAAGGKRPLPAK